MREQGDDPRALCVAWMVKRKVPDALLERAAQMDYAPALGVMSATGAVFGEDEKAFAFAQRAAAKGDRYGAYALGYCFWKGNGCAKDLPRAIELFREGAKLEHRSAKVFYGELAFGELEWERY
jgi:TPR repeat protein